ncbi:MAG: PAS domain S-box protein [Verrucomicrobia bacterium]|nr:PAS domain S-box protein [Verrucomicrobiota bacterium]
MKSGQCLLRPLVDSFPDHIYVKDTASRFLVVNLATARLFGAAAPGEIIGKTDFDFFPREAAEQFRAEEQALMESARALVNRESSITDSSGNTRWLLTIKMPLRDDHGRIAGLLGVNRDITDYKRAEEQLLLMGRAVEQSATLVVISNSRGDIEYVNPKFTQVTGYTLEEVKGRNVRIFKSGRTPQEEYARLWESVSAGREWRGDFCNRKKNGDFYWASATISPIKNTEGVITHHVSVQEDITERKQAEQQLQRLNEDLIRKQQELLTAMGQLKAAQMQVVESAKLETIGRLAAGVVHEVKNPLSVLKLGIDYLLRQPSGETADTAQMLRDMQHAVQQASNVVGELLSLGRTQELTMETVNMHDVLESALTLLRVSLAEGHIKVIRELAPGLPALRLDRRKIEQVFINLAMNAAHAMAGGGTLTVRTRVKQFDPAEAGANCGPQSDSQFRPGDTVVVVEMDDTGGGIPEDKLSKVFDPFFTTKPEGKGTGLGLTVCRTIIGVHGGSLHICNRPEGGVRVSVMFKA